MKPTRLDRTLLFSTLYPSAARPVHGVFVETRLRELLTSGQVQTKVVAPVPWFPSKNPRFGAYAQMAGTPARECRDGIDILHPRYLHIPRVGMALAPFLLAAACVSPIRRLIREGFDFDLIDAHYFYPDGVAAALLSRWLGKPLVITARGSDINMIAGYALPRRLIQWAAGRAAAVIGVSMALVEAMRSLGLDSNKLHAVRNGVDLVRFNPLPPGEARRQIGLSGGPVILSVGNLVANKGHDLVIDAVALLAQGRADVQLIIVGSGRERTALEEHARQRGVAERVTFAGTVPNSELFRWYSAADVLVLASSREGWPNVLLEAMACGTPVAATRVGGIPEVIGQGMAGHLFARRDAAAIAQTLDGMLNKPAARNAVRRYAEQFDWSDASAMQLAIFRRLLAPDGVHCRA